MTALTELLPAAAADRGDAPALVGGDRRVSYRELDERTRRAAAALQYLGVGPGDRVALVEGNTPAFVEALYGSFRAGAVAAPLNVLSTPEELGAMLADAEATVALVSAEHLPAVLAVRDRIASLGHVLVTGGRRAPRGTRSFERLLEDAGEPAPPPVGPDDLAVLAYTAGTTARPRGAMLTHGNLASNLEQISRVPALREGPSDVVLVGLPLFHIFGLNAVLGVALREGATVVLVERFDPGRTLDLVATERVTILPGAPPMFAAWLRAAEGRPVDLSSVRLAVSGAAPLPGALLEAFRERFGITIWEGYGLTETAPAVTSTALGEEARPGSIGRVLPDVEVRLVDEDGEDVEEGDPGEIVVRGPNVFRGYWRRPEETEAAFRDGWFRTGDVAYRDDDGYLHIVDRRKDMVIVSGFNVFPAEVEEAIVRHPKVADCAVIGIPDDRTGEAIKAIVVPRPGEELTEDEILDHCRALLARFKWPRVIEIADELPRHDTGKVRRRLLREGQG
ncbi:MAG TPA: long-chain fatty acid--CoA ligase [Actinomycetota bacterium]|nr:long-chain fatty acid--CoA ligase [Actinomycetota bacterium]